MEVIERRAALLGALQQALSTREVYVRIGAENDLPALRSMSMVAANYGLPSAQPRHGLGHRADAHGLRGR